MILLSFARILKFSLQDIGRNIWLSIVTITILILALFSINMLLTVQVISNGAVEAVKQKIDISLYLTMDASEDQIMALKGRIASMNRVREVRYISREEALEFFRQKNENNPEILTALREIGRNPLSPSLIILPVRTEEAGDLIQELTNIDSDIIESRNFADNRTILEKINLITKKISEVGVFVSAMFILITLLVVFYSVRISIYTHRKEIAIMRLVGASKSFIYLPFVLSALFYALLGTAIIVAIYFPFLSLLQPYLEVFFVDYGMNIVGYFHQNFIQIFGLQFAVIAFINVLASLIAVRKYANV